MTQNIFALIAEEDKYEIQRVKVDAQLQEQLTSLLLEQESDFMKGDENEILFDGTWKPSEGDILYLNEFEIITEMKKAIISNTSSYDDLDLNNYAELPIKALFSGYQENGDIILQIQRFTTTQILSRKFLLIWEGQKNTFRQLNEPTFSFDNKISALVKEDKLYFKSWANIRNMFNINSFFAEATKPEIDKILQHPKIKCVDPTAFESALNSNIRRDLHLLSTNNILDQVDLTEVSNASNKLIGKSIIENNQIIFPHTKKEIIQTLDLLLDNLFEAPISKKRYKTNSKAPIK